MLRNFAICAMAGTIAATAVAAKPNDPPPPAAAVRKLADCRALTDPTDRLACFDREVGALVVKVERKELALVDRATV